MAWRLTGLLYRLARLLNNADSLVSVEVASRRGRNLLLARLLGIGRWWKRT
jgi:hypothetical protein